MKNSSNNPNPRAELLELQKATFAHLQDEIRSRILSESKEIRAYRNRYQREIKTYRSVSSKAELVSCTLGSDIVYCGDFHTLRQAQRTSIRILRSIVEKRSKVILALEMIPQSGQQATNQYLAGEIDEAQFLQAISYTTRWGFEWEHYRQLFDFAREHQLSIVALNSDVEEQMPLSARDDLAADLIVDATLEHPKYLIFCVYGDLHIADAHIPRRVETRLRKHRQKRKTVTVFQNSEPIYWQLAEKGLAHKVDVVALARNKFCVLSSAPWIKWQSYRTWLEDQTDLLSDPEDEAEQSYIELPKDYYHQVLDLADRIVWFLKLRTQDLEQFSIYTADDIQMIDELKKYCRACRRRDLPIEQLIKTEIVVNRSCLLPDRSVLFLSDLSFNRAAEKAAQLVASKLGQSSWVYRNAVDRKECFYRIVLWEAIGFFGSKIINPKRKCDQYRDFEKYLESVKRRRLADEFLDQKVVASQILKHRAYQARRLLKQNARGAPRAIYRLAPRHFFSVASAIGQILANRLYSGMVSDELSMGIIRQLFAPLPKTNERPALNRYWYMLEQLRHYRSHIVSKDDQL